MSDRKQARVGKDLETFLSDFKRKFDRSMGLMVNKKVVTSNVFTSMIVGKGLRGHKALNFKLIRIKSNNNRKRVRLVFDDKEF